MAPWYLFLTDLGDRDGKTAIRSIRTAALAIRVNKSSYCQSRNPQSSSGNKGGKSYCQSRNGLTALCMRVRLAIFLANTCHHSNCFRYTYMMPWYRFLTNLGDRGRETAIRSICRAALAIRAEKFLFPEQISTEQLWL